MGQQDRFEGVEDLFFAADHEGKGAVNRLGFAAGNGGVQHLDAVGGKLGGDLLAGDGVQRGHINKGGAGLHVGGNAVCTQHDLFDLRGVGQHGQYKVTGGADGGLVGYFGAAGFQLSCGGGGVAVHRNVIAGFEQVFGHGAAHNAKTDKTNFHTITRPFLCKVYLKTKK